MNKISVILPILLHNRYLVKLTDTCIRNLRMFTDYKVELIVVHNQSQLFSPDVKKMLKKGDVYIDNKDTNQNSGKCINDGVKVASGELLCILANDVMVHQDWLLYAREALDAGNDFVIPWMWKIGREFYQDAVEKSGGTNIISTNFTDGAGNCCVFSREAYNRVGPLDENLIIHCDRDYHYRIAKIPRKKPIRVVNHLKSFVTHLGSMTWTGFEKTPDYEKLFGWTMSHAHEADHQHFLKKWNTRI